METIDYIPRVVALIAAGGTGSRLGHEGGKQLLEIESRPVVAWTVDAIAAAPEVARIVVICDENRVVEFASAIFESTSTDKPLEFVPGGATRQDSVAAGLAFTEDADLILIHDGARPLITPKTVSEMAALLRDSQEYDGVVAGQPSVDTIKVVGPDRMVKTTVNRSEYWSVQTPQIFSAEMVRNAYASAASDGFLGTDDSSLVERIGGRIKMYEAPRDNIKITLPEDVAFARASLAVLHAHEGDE